MSKKKSEKIQIIHELGRRYSDANVTLHSFIAAYAGLAPADHKYLGIILEKGSMTAGELSNYTGLTTGAVTGLVDRLSKKKLVDRLADKTDRRKIFIVPNYKQIQSIFGSVFGNLIDTMEKHLNTFSDSELDTVTKYLSAMVESMESQATKFIKKK